MHFVEVVLAYSVAYGHHLIDWYSLRPKKDSDFLSSGENSGISPKRHGLRIPLNLLMYNIKYGQHRLNVQF